MQSVLRNCALDRYTFSARLSGIGPIGEHEGVHFRIFICFIEIAFESSCNFLTFFDNYSINSPRKSEGSRNIIRAELRRPAIPTRNARPDLVVGEGGSGSQAPIRDQEIVHFARYVCRCHKPLNSAPRRIFPHSGISDNLLLANRADRVRISSGTAGLGAPKVAL